VTAHLASLGARQVPRRDFVRDVKRLADEPGHPLPWAIDTDLPAAL
jgi:Leu/Phe-tRNA-protein transferase